MRHDAIAANLLAETLRGLASVAGQLSETETMEVISLLAHREYGLGAETLLDIVVEKNLQSEPLMLLREFLGALET